MLRARCTANGPSPRRRAAPAWRSGPLGADHTRRARSGHGRPRVVLVRVYPANTSEKSDRCAR
eukprot:scaffold26907_cov72-Phaeocystis_antarctica.AAC.2